MTPNSDTCRNVAFYVSTMSHENALAAMRKLYPAIFYGMIEQGCSPHEALRFTEEFGVRVLTELETLTAPDAALH